MRFIFCHPTFQRSTLKTHVVTFSRHSSLWAESLLCQRSGACSPNKQLVQELLGSGEGRVDGQEGGDIEVYTWGSWYHRCYHPLQCIFTEGLHPAVLI